MTSAAGAKKFDMMSTDKAVNSTNLLGTSKRIAEMIVQHNGRKTSFILKQQDLIIYSVLMAL
jgi:FlaA1/EpsC-like NDP-sugar epimerase